METKIFGEEAQRLLLELKRSKWLPEFNVNIKVFCEIDLRLMTLLLGNCYAKCD